MWCITCFCKTCFMCLCVLVRRCVCLEAVPTGTSSSPILFSFSFPVLLIRSPCRCFRLPCSGCQVFFRRAFFSIVFVLTVIKTYIEKEKRVECTISCVWESTYTHMYVDCWYLFVLIHVCLFYLAGYVLSFTYMFMSIVALLAPCHQSSKRRVRFRKTCNPMHAIKKHMFAKYIHVANMEDKCVPKQYNKRKN